MNTYHVFYKGRKLELLADSSYHAQLKGAAMLGALKSYQVTVVLVAIGDREIIHVAVD